MVIDGSTVPMFVSEDERLMAVSCKALAGFPVESCNCTKMQLYVLLSARTLDGPMKILRLAGSVVAARDVFWLKIINEDARRAKINVA